MFVDMKLSAWHRLRQADEIPNEGPDQGFYGHDYSNEGTNPLVDRPMLSESPPGEPEHDQQGDLVLILKKKGKALVVDPRQHYLVITFKKDWWDGIRKDLGAIGREKALHAFNRN